MADDEKIYSKAEFEEKTNRIVEERLARQEKTLKTEFEKTIGEKESALSAATTKVKELEGVSATAAEKDALLKEAHEALLEAIPEAKRPVFAESTPLVEQIKFIKLNKASLLGTSESPPIKPQIPDDEKPLEGSEAAKFGGYSSWSEFAQRDKKGYEKAKREGKVK